MAAHSTQSSSLPTPKESADRFVHLLRARKFVGPICEWCEAIADEHEAEYRIDHNASSDLLRGADYMRVGCRAGEHASQAAYERVARGPGRHRPRPPWRWS